MSDPISRLNATLEGRYHVERELGEGGMATVYLADDLKHERKVALKVLKPELVAVVGAERFLAEIKTTANLQHPNILPLFDSGEADSLLFYAMPFVEGESLRDRLDRARQLPVGEAVGIATSVADALDYAHRKGVIHRDIKPENILLQDGKPVISDFGIALAMGVAGAGRLTETGMSLGTPHYMSPEQATGEMHVGAATDIYGLGCVLFEMLVGEPPFTGATAQAVLAKILTGETASATEARPSIPANVDAAIRVALERLPADRFASAADFAGALRDSSFGLSFAAAEPPAAQEAKTRLLTMALVASLAASAVLLLRPQPRVPTTYDLAFPDEAPMRLYLSETYSLPSDASFIVYEAASDPPQLWVRDNTTAEARPIPGTENATSPIVSLAGDRIYFVRDGQMHTASIDGQGQAALSEFDIALGHFWAADGRLAVVDRDGLMLRWYDSERQVRADTTKYCIGPSPLSASRFVCGGGGAQYAHMVDLQHEVFHAEVFRLAENPDRKALLRGADFTVVDERYLVYVSREGDLRGTIVDLEELTVGQSALLIPGVRREAYSGLGHYQITEDGTLYYVPGVNASVGQFVRRQEDQVEVLPVPPDRYVRFSISPDGSRFATVADGVDRDRLRTYDVANGWRDLDVWLEAFYVWHPEWSADGSKILVSAYDSLGAEGVLLGGAPGTAESPDTLLSGLTFEFTYSPTSYLSDSLVVGFDEHIIVSDLTQDPITYDTLSNESIWFPTLSPNGRFIATAQYGDYTIRIRPFSDLGPGFVLTDEGLDPRWISDSELVYFTWPDGEFFKARINPDTGEPVGEPEFWFDDPRFAETPGPSHTVGPNGSLIYLQSLGTTTASHLRVIPNWVEQMKAAVDEANR